MAVRPGAGDPHSASSHRPIAYLFTTTGTSPISGFSKAKARLDRLVADANSPLSDWRLHDLRRSFVSGCTRLRIPAEVVERAVNHIAESFGDVRGVYNVHAYEDERREAMRAWAAHVMVVVNGRPDNIVAISDRRAA